VSEDEEEEDGDELVVSFPSSSLSVSDVNETEILLA
jgi:hypothetical protein